MTMPGWRWLLRSLGNQRIRQLQRARQVAPIAQRATGRLFGPDFLAAYRQVSQIKGGRTGEEAIILAGIDTAALGERQKVILAWLEDLLADLERLVTEEIDWSQIASDRMLIDSETLNLWMKRLKERLATEQRGDASLPVYVPSALANPRPKHQPVSASPRTPARTQRQPYALMVSIALGSLIVGGIFGWISKDLSQPAQSEIETESTMASEIGCSLDSQPVFQTEVRSCDCSDQESELLNSRHEITRLKSELSQKNQEITTCQNRWSDLKNDCQKTRKVNFKDFSDFFDKHCNGSSFSN